MTSRLRYMQTIIKVATGMAIMLVCCGSAVHATNTSVAFWRPYSSNQWTYALFSFDGKNTPAGVIAKDATMENKGKIAFDAPGMFGQAFANTSADGMLIVHSGEILNIVGHHCSGIAVEAWINPDALPTQGDAAIVSRTHQPNISCGLTLGITDGGAVFLETTNTVRNKMNRFQTRNGVIRPGVWAHIAAQAHGYPIKRKRIFINGEVVFDEDLLFGEGIARMNENERKPSPLVIGNCADGKRPFIGKIDELRIQPNIFQFWPHPKVSAFRPVDLTSNGAFFQDLVALGHLSFEKDAPEIVELKAPSSAAALPDGVIGKAWDRPLNLKRPSWFHGTSGAVEAWIMPREWDSLNGFHLAFVDALAPAKKPFGFRFCIPNSGQVNPEGQPTALMIRMREPGQNGSDFQLINGANILWRPDVWRHVIITWRDSLFSVYVDGVCLAAENSDALKGAAFQTLTLLTGHTPGMTLIDEVYTYNRALSPDEAFNAYARYMPGMALRPVRKAVLEARLLPGQHQVIADIMHYGSNTPQSVELTVRNVQGKILSAVSTAPKSWPAVIPINLPETLPAGEYTLVAEFKTEGQTGLTDRAPFVLREVSWMTPLYPESEPVLAPWKPLEVRGLSVCPVEREYDFSRGIVAGIKVRGLEILARPITMRGRLNGADFTLLANNTEIKRNDNGSVVNVRQNFRQGALEVSVSQRMEFDGYCEQTLTLRSQQDGNPVRVSDIVFEVPLVPEVARSFHTSRCISAWFACRVPEKLGSVWTTLSGFFARSGIWMSPGNTAEMTQEDLINYGIQNAHLTQGNRWMTRGSLVPHFWLGSAKGGFGWACDNDAGWIPKDEIPSMELIREGKAVVARLNLLPGDLLLDHPRTIRFAWIATPVKPERPESREWPTWGAGVDAFMPPHGRSSAFQPSPDSDKWDMSIERLKAWSAKKHIMPFVAYRATGDNNEWAEYFRHEWFPGRKGPFQSVGYSWDQMVPQSLLDYHVWAMGEWTRRSGVINGVYIDMIYPGTNTDTLRGTAYKLADGQIQPGWNMSDMRRYVKRHQALFQMQTRKPPHVICHMTHCNMPTVLSFTDIALEGECNYYHAGDIVERAKNGLDPMAYWTPEILDATDDSAAMGYRFSWLNPLLVQHPDPAVNRQLTRAMGAVMIIGDSGQMSKPEWMKTAMFTPYYNNSSVTFRGDSRILVSLWTAGNTWAAAITNWNENQREVSLTLSGIYRRDGTLFDVETGMNVAEVKNGAMSRTIPVAARDYRFIAWKNNGDVK